MNFHLLSITFVSSLFLGCTTNQDQNNCNWSDYLEKFNRSIFNFNYNMLDPYLIRPTAVIWKNYIPKPARNGLSNFFNNLEEPSTTINYFIQGKPYKAMVHFNRFFLNTLLGMGGLMDVAAMTNPKLAKEEPRRFGSTLGNYGVGYGLYIQLPSYGSFTIREDLGNLIDDLYPMLSYLTWWMSLSKWILEGLENRAQFLDSDSLLRNVHDPYAMIRAAYFQHHDFLIYDDVLTLEENPNALVIQKDLNLIDIQ